MFVTHLHCVVLLFLSTIFVVIIIAMAVVISSRVIAIVSSERVGLDMFISFFVLCCRARSFCWRS